MSNPQVMAILETHNFTFYAFAETKKQALELMRERWILHQKKTGATYTFSDLRDEIFVCGIVTGAYEDNELPKPPKAKKVLAGVSIHLVPQE